ncbi:TlpA disulfide reductase family protein [uncultured Chitinophaga sp.]|uniref:TlpA family protein disulfide reductase n=1 Tax=uncultured Chitinophaga sp. TaxID=339340 RepID=UPI00261F2013|nr:TlpA disulfide reductase family protein [uncultured Chitinophaga sp.]
MELLLWKNLPEISQASNMPHVRQAVAAPKGNFRFTSAGLSKPGYFTLNILKPEKKTILLNYYLIETGDAIDLRFTSSAHAFTPQQYPTYMQQLPYDLIAKGNGTAKIMTQWKLEKATGSMLLSNNAAEVPSIFNPAYSATLSELGNFEKKLHLLDSMKHHSLAELQRTAGSFTPDALNLTTLNIITHFNYSKLREYVTKAWLLGLQKRDTLLPALQAIYTRMIRTDTTPGNLTRYYPLAPLWLSYTVERTYQDEKVQHSTLKIDSLAILLQRYPGKDLQEYLTTNHLITMYGTGGFKGLDSVARSYFDGMQDPTLKEILFPYVQLSKGASAFPFSLPDSANAYHALADYRGKVVFIDFWYTGCGACISYYKHTLKDVEAQYAGNDSTAFFTISIDRQLPLWKKSLQTGNFTGEHAINLITEQRGTEHPIIKYYKIQGYPAPLLIDKNGKIFAKGQELRTKEGLSASITAALQYHE